MVVKSQLKIRRQEAVVPIYEYECKACGQRQEVIQKMNDDPLVECAACHKPELKKLVSAPAFRLKGGGWYETDFKEGKKKNVVKEAPEKKAPEKKAESSADSKKSSGGESAG